MVETPRKIALKPYLEAVREYCRQLSREELIEILLKLAQKEPIRMRGDFLLKIGALASEPAAGPGKNAMSSETALLDRIAVLAEEIETRINAIADGSYYEDPDDWEDDGYYDEESPDYVTSEQSEELEDLFQATGGIFLEGRLDAACRVYHALFNLLDMNGEIAGYLPEGSIDIREERARYCRCIYETVEPKDRVRSVSNSIGIDAPVNKFRLDLQREYFPMLQDVLDAKPGELPDWEEFLPAWERMLARKAGDRAAVLRLEATGKLKGIDGVSKLAREWQAGQPRGYLYWIQCLEKEGNWRGLLDVCRESLDALPKDDFREQAAEYLIRAASQLGDRERLLLGKRERFRSAPGERNLVELLGEAAAQDVRTRELDSAVASLERDRSGKSGDQNLHLKMLLMAGRLDRAFEEGRQEKSVGWTHGKAGVLFASILSVLTKNSAKAVTIDALLKEYADRRDYDDDDDDEYEAKTAGVYEEILIGLRSVPLCEPEVRKYAAWALKTGRARIEAIVSGQFRNAYDRAARVLGALAEYCILSNETEQARVLLREFVFITFKRHHAFRREVKAVAARSPLIKALGVI